MTFRVPWFRSSTTQSDEGFSITLKSWERLQYKRGELTIDLKIDAGAGFISLVSNSLYDLNPGLKGRLTSSQEKEIFSNIVDALSWRGWKVDLVSDRDPL
jgi:hypothetical protein